MSGKSIEWFPQAQQTMNQSQQKGAVYWNKELQPLVIDREW